MILMDSEGEAHEINYEDSLGAFLHVISEEEYVGWWPQDVTTFNYDDPENYAKIKLLGVGVEEPEGGNQMSEVRLQSYPNPFSTKTLIRVQGLGVSEKERVVLKIYDLSGRLVRAFNHLTNQPFDQIVWHGEDDVGKKVPSGVYFFVFASQAKRLTQKLILLR